VSYPRVLLADDDALNLALHREVLEGAGFVVDTATNGEQAFALWQRSHHPLIFSDGSMPIMSGLDFVTAVRAASRSIDGEKPHRPWFVLLTSYSSSLDRDDYLRAGVDDFIEKPLLPRGLQEALARRDAVAAATTTTVSDR
jgi:CheY-like chemotaxis protein